MSQKKVYVMPAVADYGTIEELTQQTKNKVWGGGDDVLVNNQAILANS